MTRPEKITAWINAFIPSDIPSLTREVPSGSHRGSTVIPGPIELINDCFLTDQREFDDDPEASSRMHSEFILEIDGDDLSLSEQHRCDLTVELDCEDGDIECEDAADTTDMGFTLDDDTIQDGVARVHVNSSASNPCFLGAPRIIFLGVFEIDFVREKVQFTGAVKHFPAYEGYVRFDDGEPHMLFTVEPEEGATPWRLLADPTREVEGVASFPS